MTDHEHRRRRAGRCIALFAALGLILAASACGERADEIEPAEEAEAAAGAPGDAGDAIDVSSGDLGLHVELEAGLAGSEELRAQQINTEVSDGVARLTGEVDTEAQSEEAARIALSVDGIDEVRNELALRDEDPTIGERLAEELGDARITAEVGARLLANANTSGLAIVVETDDAVVTLDGEVKSEDERELAALIAANTSGVRDVRNKIEVK